MALGFTARAGAPSRCLPACPECGVVPACRRRALPHDLAGGTDVESLTVDWLSGDGLQDAQHSLLPEDGMVCPLRLARTNHLTRGVDAEGRSGPPKRAEIGHDAILPDEGINRP